MRNFKTLANAFLIIGLAIWLAGCGGSSDSDSEVGNSADCLLGSTKIGECKI